MLRENKHVYKINVKTPNDTFDTNVFSNTHHFNKCPDTCRHFKY